MTATETAAALIQDAHRPPSFVDLRAFAAEVGERLHGLAADRNENPYLANRVALQSSGTASPVAALILPAGEGLVEALPHDEFILLLEGQLLLSGENEAHLLSADDAAVLPHGCRLAWRAEEAVTAIILRYPQSRPGRQPITPISANPPLSPSTKPAEDVLLGPAPDCHNFNDYRVDEGKFVCGTWTSTPYRRKAFLYGHFEIMLLREGAVTFSDEYGRAQTFSQGDVILAETGSRCAWDSREVVTKLFAIYRTC